MVITRFYRLEPNRLASLPDTMSRGNIKQQRWRCFQFPAEVSHPIGRLPTIPELLVTARFALVMLCYIKIALLLPKC